MGVHTTATGTMYMGEWVNGTRTGFGCELSGDGDWYRGQFDEDAVTGMVSQRQSCVVLLLNADHAVGSHTVVMFVPNFCVGRVIMVDYLSHSRNTYTPDSGT